MADLQDKIYEWHLNKPKRERKIGKYYSSEVWDIVERKLKPEDFFKKTDFPLFSAIAVEIGNVFDELLKEVLKNEYEIDKHFKIELEKGCIISGKLDLFKNGIPFEIKTCKAIPSRPYPNHAFQVECYIRGTQATHAFITYIHKDFTRGIVSKSYTVLPDDKRWNVIKTKVLEFHRALVI